MRTIFKIGNDDFYIPTACEIIGDNDQVPNGYTDILPMIDNGDGTYKGYYKAKWNGSSWEEGATQEEIDQITYQPPRELTDIEILQQQNAQLLLASAQQAQMFNDLQTQNAAIMLQLAQLQPGGAS